MAVHMSNNPFFPRGIKKGDKLKVKDPNGEIIEVEVIGVWYPEECPIWNESNEIERLGYLGSKPDKPFPQILTLTPKKRRLVIYGDDYKDLTIIS